jgi:hypothetical protein
MTTQQQRRRTTLLLLITWLASLGTTLSLHAQGPPSQTLRGKIIDASTERPIPSAIVTIQAITPPLRGVTDSAGEFILRNVPVGRYELRITAIGYDPTVINELLITSAKEVTVAPRLHLTAHTLTVRPSQSKGTPSNTMATVSSRSLSVDEASRYAGGFDDPARLATSFAGVASGLGNNGVAVRGNAPKSLQWRIEGVEVENPNHFANLATFGGGGLTALSAQTLANSDFHTGAFPAEFTNALSGVFDINLRRGNSRTYEHTLQVGAIGIDLASEGPLWSLGRSSYLFNYRYATLTLLAPLLPDDAGGTSYQDLTFKLSFPAGDVGTLSIWGMGLLDRSGTHPEKDTAEWRYRQDREEQDVAQFMGTAGITHNVIVGEKSTLRTTFALTGSGLDLHTAEIDTRGETHPSERIKSTSINSVLSSTLESSFGADHSNKSGVTLTMLGYDMALQNAPLIGEPLRSVIDDKGQSLLIAAHTGSSIRLGDAWSSTIGLAAQYFTLNKSWTVEPRLGLRWDIDESNALSFGYGLHSRLERLGYYFVRRITPHGDLYPNRSLDFSKGHHLILGYDRALGEKTRLKLESYYQHLFNIPVVPGTSTSLLNAQDDWFAQDSLVNNGRGRNIGVDLTLEQFLDNGYYALLSGSLFRSQYRGGDGLWRGTRYDREYVANLLVGGEWKIGAHDQNLLSLSGRLTLQGGDRITPFDAEASRRAGDVLLDQTHAFESRLPALLLLHISAGYRINTEGTSWLIALNVINATARKEVRGYRYNQQTGLVELEEDLLVVPNLSVRCEF